MKQTQQSRINSRFKRGGFSKIDAQRGASLLITIVVMLALTALALAATNTNQNQAFMVRNAQFRLETFNASYNEIEAVIAAINSRKLSDGVPAHILPLIDGVVSDTINNNGTGSIAGVNLPIEAAPPASIDISTVKEYRGICPVFGQQLGAGSEKLRCNEMRLISTATLDDRSSILSDQHQVYEYRTLAE